MDILNISTEDCCYQKVLKTALKELKTSIDEKNEVDHYTRASDIYDKFIQENTSK